MAPSWTFGPSPLVWPWRPFCPGPFSLFPPSLPGRRHFHRRPRRKEDRDVLAQLFSSPPPVKMSTVWRPRPKNQNGPDVPSGVQNSIHEERVKNHIIKKLGNWLLSAGFPGLNSAPIGKYLDEKSPWRHYLRLLFSLATEKPHRLATADSPTKKPHSPTH